jgi:hypothetical protein
MENSGVGFLELGMEIESEPPPHIASGIFLPGMHTAVWAHVDFYSWASA